MTLEDSTQVVAPADNPAADKPEQGTLTQAQLDTAAAAARKEGQRQGIKAFVEDLGFSSADEIKTLLANMKAKEEAEKSEAQKALERADAAEKASQELKSQIEQERATNRLNNLRNQSLLELGAIGVKADRAKHALSLMEADGKLADLMGEDGTIDDKKLKSAVLDFKKEIPELFGNTTTPGTPSNADATAGSINTKELDEKAKQDMRRLIRW